MITDIDKMRDVILDKLDDLKEYINDKTEELIDNYNYDVNEEAEAEIIRRDLIEKSTSLSTFLYDQTTCADPKYIGEYLPEVLSNIWNNRNRLMIVDVEFLDAISKTLNGDKDKYNRVLTLLD